jgi:hypothetical protein
MRGARGSIPPRDGATDALNFASNNQVTSLLKMGISKNLRMTGVTGHLKFISQQYYRGSSIPRQNHIRPENGLRIYAAAI